MVHLNKPSSGVSQVPLKSASPVALGRKLKNAVPLIFPHSSTFILPASVPASGILEPEGIKDRNWYHPHVPRKGLLGEHPPLAWESRTAVPKTSRKPNPKTFRKSVKLFIRDLLVLISDTVRNRGSC
jgi:hypothetical protein